MSNNVEICGRCRFCQKGKCNCFNITVDENYAACNNFAATVKLTESTEPVRMQLND